MKKTFTFFLILLATIRIEAQSGRNSSDTKFLQVGFKAGAINTSISDLANVLVNESNYTNYTFTNSKIWGFTGGIFLNYKFEESISALYFEVSYSRLGNQLHYSDIKDLNYDFVTKYDNLNLDIWYKAYVYKGAYLGVGPRIGFNLTPGGLYYTSNGEQMFGPDIRIQQQLRDVLKGRNNFCLGVGAGYEFSFGLALDARFYFGLNDVMETEVNNFNFIENKNMSQGIQVTLGYAIPYDIKFF
jgi:hypothetical protein